MNKNSNQTNKQPNFKSEKAASRRWVMPLIAVLSLVLIAVGIAYYLVTQRQKEDASASTAVGGKPALVAQGWSKGNPSAKTVIIEFGDFQCASCARHHDEMDKVMQKHGNDLFFIFKEFPIESIHPNSMVAAQAAEAAGKQFKFWEMYEKIFSHQADWFYAPDPLTFFTKYAADLQLDLNRFQQDVWSGEVQEKIFRDKFEGQQAGVNQVPSFFINGQLMPLANTPEEFESKIAEAIKKAQ